MMEILGIPAIVGIICGLISSLVIKKQPHAMITSIGLCTIFWLIYWMFIKG